MMSFAAREFKRATWSCTRGLGCWYQLPRRVEATLHRPFTRTQQVPSKFPESQRMRMFSESRMRGLRACGSEYQARVDGFGEGAMSISMVGLDPIKIHEARNVETFDARTPLFVRVTIDDA